MKDGAGGSIREVRADTHGPKVGTMCWSEGASIAMVGLGTAATVVTARRGDPAAIPMTIAFFTLMEALQVGGYWVVDECQTTANRSVTVLSYLHIALQPVVINAFAMAVTPTQVSAHKRRLVFALASLATAMLLLRLVPFDWAGSCKPGDPLCGADFCTVTGNWHIGWEMPLNDMWRALGVPFADVFPFPFYLASVFALPLLYGAWRFVVFHALCGPLLASALTDNPNEMPAIWCLFSIGLLLIGLSPMIRGHVLGTARAETA